MKVCIYGAGVYARRSLALIKKEYEVEYILDRSDDKQGTYLEDVLVKKPSEENVNKYPIIIAMRNVISGYDSLQKYKCKQKIYVLISAGQACFIFLYNPRVELNEIFTSVQRIGGNIPISETNVLFNRSKRRCFDMVWGSLSDSIAGPAACVNKIFSLNEKYAFLDNLCTLWADAVYVPKGMTDKKDISFEISDGCCKVEDVFLSLKSYHIMYVTRYIELEIMKKYWLCMDAVFGFSTSDIFLIQDNISAYALHCVLPEMKNIVLVYHSQGSLRYEMKKSNPIAGEMYDALQTDLLKKFKRWVFPSAGAAESLFSTGPEQIKKLKDSCNVEIIHSGYNRKSNLEPTSSLKDKLRCLNDVDLTFVTATRLFYSKGVENVPVVLKKIKKKTGMQIKWILIGSGEMELAVEQNIRKYLEPNDYIWFKNRFPSQDDLFHIFSLVDFYILMHRISIFDLSILQAMSYGCIPFLSNVGGNLEFCSYDNGILVDVENNFFELDKIKFNGNVDRMLIKKLKELNEQIIKNEFSDEKFLRKYKNLVESI